MITILVWLIIIVNGIGAVFGSYLIGKPREPLTPATYIYSASFGLLIIYLLVRAYL